MNTETDSPVHSADASASPTPPTRAPMPPVPPTLDAATAHRHGAATATAASLAAFLAACGGGGGGGETPAPAPGPTPAVAPTRVQAARFLAQASLSSSATEIERVRTLGYSGWLDEQMALPRSSTNVEWLKSRGYDAVDFKNGFAGVDNMLWRKLIASPDPLRQRVALALSEIVVVGATGIAGLGFRQFAAGYFMDLLEANAFGTYRALLDDVSKSPAMGAYLTFRGNRKAAGQSVPDENYARESMQLFTIGLVQLNSDGTAKLGSNGQPQDTYTQTDVSQLARVFTGWDVDTSVGTADTPDRSFRPMVQIASRHELGEKKFLGTTIPANTDGAMSLTMALDVLLAHPNMAPFIGRQLIQRLVTSNPSAAYVGRVAAAFNNNGSGVKGDLRATVRAVLLDAEARSDSATTDPAFGKLREPVVRFVQWARTYALTDASGAWNLGDMTDPATRLGQSPLRSPSVFNFFRPGYVVPNSGINASGNRTVPEFQITTESSVAGYVNFMQRTIGSGVNGSASLRGDYTALTGLIADSAALLAELNVTLAAGQLSAATLAALKTALDTIAVTTTTGQANRLYAAITLVMAAPEYITLK
jgi:uncharacterized protein (DUF1800 family)